MTEERENVRLPQHAQPAAGHEIPRLFGDADDGAVGGAGGGDEGVGEADVRGTGDRTFHGGARRGPAVPGDDDGVANWLDPESPGVRGARPASRDELLDLIVHYREQQA